MDVELLISEIEKRPVIWDTSNEDYKNKPKKADAWVDICCTLFEDYAFKSEAEHKLIGKIFV